jgi:putative transposase
VVASCAGNGIVRSMGRTGCCYNPRQRRVVLADLQVRVFYGHDCVSMEELRAGVADYIHFYNHERRNSAIGNSFPWAHLGNDDGIEANA